MNKKILLVAAVLAFATTLASAIPGAYAQAPASQGELLFAQSPQAAPKAQAAKKSAAAKKKTDPKGKAAAKSKKSDAKAKATKKAAPKKKAKSQPPS